MSFPVRSVVGVSKQDRTVGENGKRKGVVEQMFSALSSLLWRLGHTQTCADVVGKVIGR
jgi:hypothetical protein